MGTKVADKKKGHQSKAHKEAPKHKEPAAQAEQDTKTGEAKETTAQETVAPTANNQPETATETKENEKMSDTATAPATETTDVAATPAAAVAATGGLDPRFDVKQYEKGGLYEKAGILEITMAMIEAPTDEIKYRFAKLNLERTKIQFVDPMKDIREAEKATAQKQAEERAKAAAQYRDRVNAMFADEFLEQFAEIAADYGEAGLGKILSVELFAKQDDQGKWKAEFSSNISTARAKTGESTRTRERGPVGAGVWVEGTGKKVAHPNGPTLEETQTIERTNYESFADAARHLGYVDETTEMKGLNCKRLLIGKGFNVGYQEKAETTAPPAEQAVAVISRRR